MNILAQQSTPLQSMTSLEIAELVDSRHDSVKRTIERLSDQDVIELPPTVEIKTATKPVQVYVFSGEQGKLDSITVVAQLCPHFTAQIVKRWQELEKQTQQEPLSQIANHMATLAQGMDIVLQQMNHTDSYIKLLEINQKGTVKITRELAEEVKRYRAMGYSLSEIARHLRISKTSASLIVNDKYPFAELPSDQSVNRMIETCRQLVEKKEI